ncbi:hypothetical protein PENSPDRAFT_650342 [Peniophora sp. CONT]|nr:hypothetical protein PENSPDRAFT_650342 [Peniophora sp. CONT]
MLAETTDHESPAPIAMVSAPSRPPPGKKRKRDVAHSGTATPAPDEDDSNPSTVLFTDLALRPRLTISRHPGFLPNTDGSPYHLTDPLATNRLGFRYVPAGVSSPNTFRTIESAPTCYRVSWEDRSGGLRVTQDGLGLVGEKGFRGARCNAPVREGKWYMEVTIEHGGGDRSPDSTASEGAHVRLGWARREAPLHAPCGLDGYSYALRDRTGEKITLSRPRPYLSQPLKSGDVVGMYISLPPLHIPDPKDHNDPGHLHRERIAIEFKGQEYFEALEYPQSKEMIALMENKPKTDATIAVTPGAKKSATVKNVPSTSRGTAPPPKSETLRPLPTLEGSQIAFFVNGSTPGPAFKDIYDYLPLRALGTTKLSRAERDRHRRQREGAKGHRSNPHDDGSLGYYPFISLFNDARVRINPGPDFAFPPPDDVDAVLNGDGEGMEVDGEGEGRKWRPMCERYKEFMDEQWALDDLEDEETRREIAANANDSPSHPNSPHPHPYADSPIPHNNDKDEPMMDADEEAERELAKREAKRLAKNEADRARRRRIKAEKEEVSKRENERKSAGRNKGSPAPAPGTVAGGSGGGSARASRNVTPAAVGRANTPSMSVRAQTPVSVPPPAPQSAPRFQPQPDPPTPAPTHTHSTQQPTMYAEDLSTISDDDLRRDIEAERKKEAKRLAKNEADRARRRRLKLAKEMAKDQELQAAIAAAKDGPGSAVIGEGSGIQGDGHEGGSAQGEPEGYEGSAADSPASPPFDISTFVDTRIDDRGVPMSTYCGWP